MTHVFRTLAAVTALLVVAGVGTVSAQDGPDAAATATTGAPLRLTLEQAVARGLEVGEEVAAAMLQQDLAESQVMQARAGAMPQVSAQLGYNRTLASVFDAIGQGLAGPGGDEGGEDGENPFASLPFGRRNTWNATLQISQALYSGGRVGAGLDIAREVRRAAELELEEVRADLSHQIRTAYFEAVLADELVAIAEEARRLASDQFEHVELLQRQGTASDFDVLRAAVDRDNLEPNVVQARNARRVAELNLKRLINLPADQPLELVTALAPEIVDVDRVALREALASRPALAALDAVVAARDRAIDVVKADRLPTVNAVGVFGQQAFPDGVSPIGTDWRRDWAVGLQATIPIFDGLRTAGRIDQAETELRQAELQRDQTRQAIELEFEAALGEFDAARSQIEARRATVEQAERALELAELRFANGLATQLDVSNARLMHEQARVNEAQALYSYVSALARLERVTGGVVPLLAQRLPGG